MTSQTIQDLELPPSIILSAHMLLNNSNGPSRAAKSIQSKLPNFLRKNIIFFVATYGTLSLFFFIFAVVLRKGENQLIPIAIFFQSFAYFFIPVILINKNKKLKSFTGHRVNYFIRNIQENVTNVNWNLKFKHHQVHPSNIES